MICTLSAQNDVLLMGREASLRRWLRGKKFAKQPSSNFTEEALPAASVERFAPETLCPTTELSQQV